MMRRRFFLALAACVAACSPDSRRPFPIGFLEPLSPRAAAEAGRMGLEIAAQAPAGAATVPTGVALEDGAGEVAAAEASLRLSAARAVAGGSIGVFFRLPRTPPDRDILDYVEEWRAVSRIAQELSSLRPVLERGALASGGFESVPGLETRGWTFQGRRYALLVNSSGGSLPLEEERLAPWRALFAVRSDPRQLLVRCGKSLCLPPGGTLWLEGCLGAP
jgi:hypothetical protein